MAKLAHKRILFDQGVEIWNRWRKDNPNIIPDLSGILLGPDTFDFSGGNFSKANFSRSNFHTSDFKNVDLSNADLREANFAGVSFDSSSLIHSLLGGCTFFDCSFINTNLSYASLDQTIFTGAFIQGANFSHANISDAIFLDTLLSKAKGLEKLEKNTIIHLGLESLKELHELPKEVREAAFADNLMIEVSKLYKKRISISEIDDTLYEIHDMLIENSIQINPLFISYSHKDSLFVDSLSEKLKKSNIRFFRDVNDAPAGRLEKVVNRAIRRNPTVILILSKHSINSDWVQHEARVARSLEIELKRDVLCPIALDASWKNSQWPERLQEQIKEYNILNFSNWKKPNEMNAKFNKLIEGLDIFYKVSK